MPQCLPLSSLTHSDVHEYKYKDKQCMGNILYWLKRLDQVLREVRRKKNGLKQQIIHKLDVEKALLLQPCCVENLHPYITLECTIMGMILMKGISIPFPFMERAFMWQDCTPRVTRDATSLNHTTRLLKQNITHWKQCLFFNFSTFMSEVWQELLSQCVHMCAIQLMITWRRGFFKCLRHT